MILEKEKVTTLGSVRGLQVCFLGNLKLFWNLIAFCSMWLQLNFGKENAFDIIKLVEGCASYLAHMELTGMANVACATFLR